MSADVDVVIVGGGLAGSTLAGVIARAGRKVHVLERETKFKDRVRGENILPWGVAAARRLGIVDALLAGGGRPIAFFNWYAMGQLTERRPLAQTTPHGEGSINIYHPDLQDTMLKRAVAAGAEVTRGATVQGVAEHNGRWTVTFDDGGAVHTVSARLVVGADGRFSKMRDWGGFATQRHPDFLRVAGALVEGTPIPDDGVHFCVGPGVDTFIAPLGNKRARMYAVYIGPMGDRKLSGKDKVNDFLACCRATGAPAEWFAGVDVVGPLAEFEGADAWVPSPGKPGLALIGDAAAATDPSWGNGLSKTLVDVETLAKHLTATDDWTSAVENYAAEHDDYSTKLRNILAWMTELVWSGGPDADARRQRVFPKMQQDPTGYPDPIGQGPFGPSDETARRLILGLA